MTGLLAAPPRSSGLRGRVGVAVAGHGVASGSNLVMTVLAARELSVTEFGAFGVAFALSVVISGVARSLIGEPALVRSADDADAARDIYASGALLGVLAGGLVATAGAATGGSVGSALVALGVVVPGMVILDLGRHLAFARLQPGRALTLDLTWAVLQVGGILLLVSATKPSAASIVLVWGAAGSAAGVVALVMCQCGLARPSLRWIRESWSFSWRYLVGFAATLGVVQVATLVLGWVDDLAAVGSVRGAQILLGPLIPLYTGVSAVLVPEGARLAGEDGQFRSHLVRMSVLMAVSALTLTAIGLLASDEVGREVLGDTWASAREILLPAGIAAALGGAGSGAQIGLRASRAVRTTLAVQLRLVPVYLVLPIVGAVWWNTSGFMWATVATAAIAASMWWRYGLRPLGSLP